MADFFTPQADQYAAYALCGAYATCSTNRSPPCACREGFVPKSPAFGDWNTGDWSEGCLRRTPLVCDGGDGFLKQTLLKFPDTSHAWANNTMCLEDCQELCSRNCSCTAYAYLDPKEGTGCLLWFGELINMTELSKDGLDLYIRLATSELGSRSLPFLSATFFSVCENNLASVAVNENNLDLVIWGFLLATS